MLTKSVLMIPQVHKTLPANYPWMDASLKAKDVLSILLLVANIKGIKTLVAILKALVAQNLAGMWIMQLVPLHASKRNAFTTQQLLQMMNAINS